MAYPSILKGWMKWEWVIELAVKTVEVFETSTV